MSLRIVDLPWLPPAPADFKDRCSQFAQKKGGNGAEIRSLGLHALSANQLNRLHKAAKATTDSAPLTPVRLAVLSNSNTEFLPPVLSASALRHGVSLDVMILPYGQVAQEVFDPNSDVMQDAFDKEKKDYGFEEHISDRAKAYLDDIEKKEKAAAKAAKAAKK